jgi:hypothetical protein
MDWDQYNEQLDEFSDNLQQDVNYVFLRALSEMPDNPEHVTMDIILLLLLDDGLGPVIDQLPYRDFAQQASGFIEDPPSKPTRGLDDKLDSVKDAMKGEIQKLAQDLMNKANKMKLTKKAGFREAAEPILNPETFAPKIIYYVIVWQRTVLETVSEEMGEVKWTYDGPQDDKNRPFCADMKQANKAYTRAEIEELNNHPLLATYVPPNVFLECGGYGCRHMFVPVRQV